MPRRTGETSGSCVNSDLSELLGKLEELGSGEGKMIKGEVT